MHIASLFADDPYSGLFYGKVVDMFYFPLIDTVLPDWMHFVGGNHFRFFEPVFNVADTCISFGVFVLILFNKTAFSQED
jgi:signal peptidase II